ncbi:hypothetical protein HYX02_08185 [Candidatus Woesearchaeota archaeon]|nr:hypothetical protein [Candidatus Woesearchaeota archaeon]
MERTEIQKSYCIWNTLITTWYDLVSIRKFFDLPEIPQAINARVYLDSIGESIDYQFNVVEFVLRFYGSRERYMQYGNSFRRTTDIYCSENVLLAFKKLGDVHLEHDKVEDLERLLRSYLMDTSQPKTEPAQKPKVKVT